MCERLMYENQYYNLGYQYIAGVDEAGRGPLAGPVVVGAVIFERGFYDERIQDSKKLTEKKRELLFDFILEKALSYAIIIKDQDVIDKINIYEASRLGMQEAIAALKIKPDFVLSDAMPLGKDIAHLPIIMGDAKSMSIAGASILAKVTRDRIMKEYDAIYPGYGYAKHKGYPTKMHLEAIETLGLTPIHRKTFAPCQRVLQHQTSLELFK